MHYSIILSAVFSLMLSSCDEKIQTDENQQFDQQKIYYTIFIWYLDSNKLRQFENEAAPYFKQYGLQLHRIINEISSIPADGAGHFEAPDEIQLVSAVNEAALGQLFADTDFQKLLPIREQGVKKMTIVSSSQQQIQATSMDAEIYGVGVFYFEDGGEKKLRQFEKQASPYFETYDLNISHFLTSDAVLAAIGEDNIEQPDEIQFITVKSNKKLEGLFSDQGFLDLVPLRSEATKRLTFFLGKKLL